MLPPASRFHALLAVCWIAACSSASATDGGGGTGTVDSTSSGGSNGAESSNSPSGTSAAESTAGDGPIYDVAAGVDLGGGPFGDPCQAAATQASSIGCEFFAVDLDQFDLTEDDQFAVAVANVDDTASADVTVEVREGDQWVAVAGPQSVGPLDLRVFELPDRHQESSGVRVAGAYRISSTHPISAYQFNPLRMESFTSDASLLHPTAAWDTLAFVPAPVAEFAGNGQAAKPYITLVAGSDGTVVEVIPTTPVLAGDGVPAGAVGMPMQIELDAGDIVELTVPDAPGGHDGQPELGVSFSGTRIESNLPVAVFPGHECAVIPDPLFYCDHIEEQLSGVRTWGRDFVAARMPVRSLKSPEPSLWQVIASETDTTVEFSAAPGVIGVPGSVALDSGEQASFLVYGNFDQPGDFVVHADKPIALVNYMTAATMPASIEAGDPAMLQLMPTEQYQRTYVLLVPDAWNTDVLVVTRPAGLEITLDGGVMADGLFAPIDDGTYEVARVVTSDGVHELTAEQPFAVAVVGYDLDDSYAYLGGAGIAVINPEPAG